jgi:SPP1 family predicted phage head-tail adaptor
VARACAKYAPAAMRHRVTIQSVSRASDGQGGFTETWADGATVWASVEQTKAWEKFQAMQEQTPVVWAVTLRYRADVTTASRLKYGTRILWVKEVINVSEDDAFLAIQAIERS